MSFSSPFIEQIVKIDSTTLLEQKRANLSEASNNFLSSFPRSGNGWVRLILALIFLEINGIDINKINIVQKKTKTGVQYLCLNSDKISLDIEDIFPDIYLLEVKNKEMHYTSDIDVSVKLIKTHQIVNCDRDKALFLFRDPLSCLTSASLLLNGEQINKNPHEINLTIKYLANIYSQMLDHYLLQHQKNPQNCFFINHGLLSTKEAVTYLVAALKFININVSVTTINKVLKKFPLKSGYNKSFADFITDETKTFIKDSIQSKYELAVELC